MSVNNDARELIWLKRCEETKEKKNIINRLMGRCLETND